MHSAERERGGGEERTDAYVELGAAEEQRPDDVWLEDILPRLLALGMLLLVPSSDGQRLRCGLGHVDPLPEVAAVLW